MDPDEKNDNEWIQVTCRKFQPPLIKPLNRYWDGFDSRGRKRWYIELTDGRIMAEKNREFRMWNNRYEVAQKKYKAWK